MSFYGALVVSLPTTAVSADIIALSLTICAALLASSAAVEFDNVDVARSNSIASAMAPVPLILTTCAMSQSALALLIVLELSSLCFAGLFFAHELSIDTHAVNSFFWASAIVSFSLLLGLSSLAVEGSVVAAAHWSASGKHSLVELVFGITTSTAILTKLGVQPVA